jgi:hypothetical protein
MRIRVFKFYFARCTAFASGARSFSIAGPLVVEPECGMVIDLQARDVVAGIAFRDQSPS